PKALQLKISRPREWNSRDYRLRVSFGKEAGKFSERQQQPGETGQEVSGFANGLSIPDFCRPSLLLIGEFNAGAVCSSASEGSAELGLSPTPTAESSWQEGGHDGWPGSSDDKTRKMTKKDKKDDKKDDKKKKKKAAAAVASHQEMAAQAQHQAPRCHLGTSAMIGIGVGVGVACLVARRLRYRRRKGKASQLEKQKTYGGTDKCACNEAVSRVCAIAVFSLIDRDVDTQPAIAVGTQLHRCHQLRTPRSRSRTSESGQRLASAASRALRPVLRSCSLSLVAAGGVCDAAAELRLLLGDGADGGETQHAK
uniref:CIA30 domain-containing protein n=1 Tax=Macrostomum lignano TaxID=282301 RepID=A0A1I8JRK1_9PLAT